MTTPALEPADLDHQGGRPTQRGEVPHPAAGLTGPPFVCRRPSGCRRTPGVPPGHRHVACGSTASDEFCEVRWPRTCRLAIGLSAPERRSVSDRQTRPATTGCFPTAATARRLTCMIPPPASPVSTGPPTRTRCAWSTSQGRVLVEFDVAHTADGLDRSVPTVERAGARRVAIERPDGPVVDALLEAGFEVVVVSRRSVKALRERYGTAGNKSDRSDAYVLADCLRTDGHRWPQPANPTRPATVTLRSHVRARKDLVETRVAVANQLRAHLRVVFPGAVGLFARHRQPDLAAVPRTVPIGHPRRMAVREAPRRLAASQRLLRPQDPRRTLRPSHRRARRNHRRRRRRPRRRHRSPTSRSSRPCAPRSTNSTPASPSCSTPTPTHRIFRSLPRCATIRAATLLAEIGDCRARFPDPESLACLAGVAPSTRATGRHHAVTFRWAATRNSATPSATSPATAGAPTPGPKPATANSAPTARRHPHAERILARSWTHIIWRCWQDRHPLRPHPTRQLPTPHQRRRLDIGLMPRAVRPQAGQRFTDWASATSTTSLASSSRTTLTTRMRRRCKRTVMAS